MTNVRIMAFLDTRVLAVGLLALLLASFVGVGVAAADERELSVPAEWELTLRLPGMSDSIRRPTALFAESTHGEIYVTDAMSNRVLVFDREGVFRYEFDCADHVAVPLGLVVDSEGVLYVLGSTRTGPHMVRFDFDGLYLSDVDLGDIDLSKIVHVNLDEDDHLILLEENGIVHVVDLDGTELRSFDVAATVPESERRGLLFGRPSVHDGEFYVPASSFGTVMVFDYDTGEYLRAMGTKGSNPGQLTFPVAVDVTTPGVVVVLDQMRFTVVCYDSTGRFLGEFGGKGYRDGWFYHPSLMVVTGDEEVLVGQIMHGRVQLCRIPRFIQARLVQGQVQGSAVDGGRDRTAMVATDGAALHTP